MTEVRKKQIAPGQRFLVSVGLSGIAAVFRVQSGQFIYDQFKQAIV